MKARSFIFVLITASLLSGCSLMAGSQPDMTGQWTLYQVDGEPVHSQGKQKGTSFTLSLDGAGSASGRVACNSWRAAYQLEGNKLSVSRAMSTKAFCLLPNDTLKRIENSFLGALENARIESVDQKQMTLISSNGQRWAFSR